MNREIKFRGRCIESNDWAFGDLIHGIGWKKGSIYILPNELNLAYVKHCDPLDGVKVKPETVGQFTGLHDNDGTAIYEGDLLTLFDEHNEIVKNMTYEVSVEGCDFILFSVERQWKWGRLSRIEELCWSCKVIGNIHEKQ